MFRPLTCFIGLRYLRPARRRGFVSFMSFASVAGIALGVAALVVILSVMNGFEAELRGRLLSMTAHASLSNPRAGVPEWPTLKEKLDNGPGVIGVSPFVQVEGMLGSGANLSPAMVRGVLPAEEAAVSEIHRLMQVGSLDNLEPDAQRIILGRILALNLNVNVGDRVNLLVPQMDNERLSPRLRSFLVAGIFEAGIQDHDANLAFAHLNDASQLKGLSGRAEGVAVRMADALTVRHLRGFVEALDLGDLDYSDWTVENANYFRAIRIEKTMMTLILMLIVAVAAFNIVASLMMVVTDKEKDIAILRTYGLEPRRVGRIFLVQGSLIALAGTLIGLVLGLLLAANVETIVPRIESTFNFQIMPGDVYYVTDIPAEIHLTDAIVIPVLAFLVAVMATIYPAHRAAQVAPAEALRYE